MTDDLLIKVPEELFVFAESSVFKGVFDSPTLSSSHTNYLAVDSYRFDESLSWEATISNTGGALLVTGRVTASATMNCARCLEDATFPLVGEIEGYFLLDRGTEEPEGFEKDEFDYLPADRIIDMELLITAALLLEWPLLPLCDEDCKGLCVQCGKNLNEGECGCLPTEDSEASDVVGANNPFAVLKDMKLED